LHQVIQTLIEQKPLEEKHRDHPLTGKYIGFRERHIQPGWLLIYRVDKDVLLLIVSRIGTHADLFGV
jgi:mRNA interferase YafQ